MISTPQAVLAFAKGEGSKKLSIEYNGQEIAPGAYVARANALEHPKLKLTNAGEGKYIVVAIDVDAPYESFNILSPILHLFRHDLTADAAGVLTSTTDTHASWVQPRPPPFSDPHKYIIVLYSQPDEIDIAKLKKVYGYPLSLSKRVRFDLPAFVTLTGLGDPVAAHYFTSN